MIYERGPEMKTYVGCSGYYYNHWIGRFYPEELSKKEWLIFYSTHFNTVEINNTFYRIPEEKAVNNWYSITPPEFIFSIKGYRFITHQKKLSVDDALKDNLNRFQKTAALLKQKTGPLLWQLPGSFKVNVSKLNDFCSVLSRDFHHVFEFRNPTWFNDEVYGILEKFGCSLCIVSGPGSVPGIIKKISKIAYIRFHGEGSWYNDNYSNEALQNWRNRLADTGAEKLFAYFNNDMNAYAVFNGKYFADLFAIHNAEMKSHSW